MKIRDWIFEPLVALLLCAMLIPDAGAQTGPYTKFGPVTGIMKGNAASPITTLAVSTDISTLFCSSSTTNFLRADGTCAVPAGSVPTGTANLVYATPNGSTGAATLRSIVLADLPLINVVGGGTGLGTLTAHGVLLGEGTSNVTPLVMGADTVLRGTASADPVATAVNNCGSATSALSYSTSTHTFGCQTITSGGTGTVTSVTAGTGLTASPNPIIATGTVSLDLTAANTWTGVQTFNAAPLMPAGWAGTASINSALSGLFINSSAGTAAQATVGVSNNTNVVTMGITGTGFSGAGPISGSPGGQYGYLNGPSSTTIPVSLGSGGVEVVRYQGSANSAFGLHGTTGINWISFGSIINSGSACSIGNTVDSFAITSCTRSATGVIVLNFPQTASAGYGCVVNLAALGFAETTARTGTSITISTFGVTSVAADLNFYFVCF